MPQSVCMSCVAGQWNRIVLSCPNLSRHSPKDEDGYERENTALRHRRPMPLFYPLLLGKNSVKVLISWSGPCSKEVAHTLRQLLPDIIPSIEPWMSEDDIQAGARWNEEVSQQLAQTSFGIICLTRENQHAPWILFEAGALAKTLEQILVCPYLIDFFPFDIENGPLAQFQAKQANKEHTWDLVRTINRTLGDAASPEDRLQRLFERLFWPELKQTLDNLPESNLDQEVKLEDMIKEIREVVHKIARSTVTVGEYEEDKPEIKGNISHINRSIYLVDRAYELNIHIKNIVQSGIKMEKEEDIHDMRTCLLNIDRILMSLRQELDMYIGIVSISEKNDFPTSE